MKKKLLFAMALSCLLTTAFVPENGPGSPYVSLGRVTVTSYQAVEEQTDGDPFITAEGTDLRETDGRVCAVSQDMLWFKGGVLRWRDTLVLYIPDYPGGPIVRCAVRDTMAARIVRHVDLLDGVYGKWAGRALLIRRGQCTLTLGTAGY